MFQVIVPHFTPLLAAVFGVTYIAAVFSSDYGEKNILGNVPKTEVSEDKAITTRLKQFSLSRRETEVVNLLIEGLSYQAIGDQLFISAGTAKTHILRIYRKTGVQSKLALYQLLTGTTKR
ncbi:MAG: response regulator transcription factor [Spirochaetia bacterium]